MIVFTHNPPWNQGNLTLTAMPDIFDCPFCPLDENIMVCLNLIKKKLHSFVIGNM